MTPFLDLYRRLTAIEQEVRNGIIDLEQARASLTELVGEAEHLGLPLVVDEFLASFERAAESDSDSDVFSDDLDEFLSELEESELFPDEEPKKPAVPITFSEDEDNH